MQSLQVLFLYAFEEQDGTVGDFHIEWRNRQRKGATCGASEDPSTRLYFGE